MTVLLLAVTFGAANKVKYLSKKIAAWDPSKHPKGAKGMFVDTPDKAKAKHVKPGDVIVTKSGKPFVVEKPTEKGVKVNPLDPVTGEQKAGYTVLAHDIDVAVVESAKGPGSAHPIGQLEPGTIVKTKTGKRFKIAKHGKESVSKTGKVSKNTTVYPVDDKGEVNGKHTILPQDHVVTVDAPHVVEHATMADLKKVDKAMEEATADPLTPWTAEDDAQLAKDMDVSLIGKKLISNDPADMGGTVTVVSYDPASLLYTVHPDGAASSVVYEESAEDLHTHYTEVDGPKPPGAYHKSPQGLAQMLVDHGYADTGYENTLSDVKDAFAYNENLVGDDGLSKDGHAFLLGYAPMMASTLQGDELVSAYDEWHTKKPKVVDAPGKITATIAPSESQMVSHVAEDLFLATDTIQDYLDAVGPQETLEAWQHAAVQLAHEQHMEWGGQTWFGWTGVDVAKGEQEIKDGIAQSWGLESTDLYDGEPPHYGVAMKALDKAIADDIPASQTPVIEALKGLPDWSGHLEAAKNPEWSDADKVGALQQTMLWQTVDNVAKELTGESLEDKYQAMLAGSKAIAHTQIPAPPGEPKPEEILPQKLPKVPKPYPAGAGEKTSIAIENVEGNIVVWRVGADGKHVQLLGSGYGSWTQAKKAARDASADHEAITQVEKHIARSRLQQEFMKGAEVGTVHMGYDGKLRRITAIDDKQLPPPVWNPDKGPYTQRSYTWEYLDGSSPPPAGNQMTASFRMGADGKYEAAGYNGMPPLPVMDEARIAEYDARRGEAKQLSNAQVNDLLIDLGYQNKALGNLNEEVVRKARPERYNKYLQQDWSADELVGSSVNDSLKALNKLGYREIKPRLKDQVRLIRADGGRLFLSRDGNTITGVHKPEIAMVSTDGAARDLHGLLSEALEIGADIDAHDPSLAAAPTARTSHVRQLVFDLAKGRQNGVAEKIGKTGAKVKTDAEYLAEIQGEPEFADTIKQAADEAERPDYAVTSPRSGTLTMFGVFANPQGDGWAYDGTGASDAFKVHGDLDEWEAAALSAILKRNGVAALVAQPDEPPPGTGKDDYLPELKATDPLDGARKLAAFWKEHQGGASLEDGMVVKAKLGGLSDDASVYLAANMHKWKPLADAARQARDDEHMARVAALTASKVSDEIATRRKAEGTVAHGGAGGAFDLPTWDEIEFEPQTYADINQLTAGIGTSPYDVPAFYTGGVLQDGVLYHRSDRSNGKVPMHMDAMVIERLQQLGAIEEANRDPIAPGVVGSYKHYDGNQLTVNDVGPTAPDPDAPVATGDVYHDGGGWLGKVVKVDSDGTVHVAQLSTPAGSYDPVETAKGAYVISKQAYTPSEFEGLPLTRVSQAVVSSGKRIEYVPHTQAGSTQGGAPTSQRGVLRMVGYTPQEAAARLRELGLLGDLEPEVPFKALMRGPRRYGAIAPMHSAYVRGEAEPPKIKNRITHGLTASNDLTALKAILDSGGLMSIAERHRQGILMKSKGSSVSGDIRSGIDHAVFCTTDGHGACGSGGMKVVMKPSAYMRRDVTLAPHDFGGCETRYGQYKSYLNKLQGEAGVPKTNLYEPVHPKVRQRWIDTASTGSGGSEEFNVGPTVAIEDIEAIGVMNESQVAEIDAYLDGLIAKGRIASRPRVVLNHEADELANTGVEATTPAGPPKVNDVKKSGNQVFIVKEAHANGDVVAVNQYGAKVTYDAASWAKLQAKPLLPPGQTLKAGSLEKAAGQEVKNIFTGATGLVQPNGDLISAYTGNLLVQPSGAVFQVV